MGSTKNGNKSNGYGVGRKQKKSHEDSQRFKRRKSFFKRSTK